MQTENDTSKPEDSPEQVTGEGYPEATCCRFADTPETNAHLGSHATSPDDTAMWLEIGLPRRFERQRDEARRAYEVETQSTIEMASRITQLEVALLGLLQAEESTIDAFSAKEIDALEAAMIRARHALGILPDNA